VIIKGGARGNGGQLGDYLVAAGKNERVEVIEVRGTVAEDVPGSVREMDAVALCTNCTKPLYHATINTPAHERLSPAQRMIAVDRLEAALGFTGQPRVVVVHEKDGREHTHIVWSRTDIEHERAIPIEFNYRRHEMVARELEREFGHGRVQGAHAEREGRARPKRTPRLYEMHQAARGALKPDEVTRIITEIWRRSDSGQAFARALAEAGFILARGNRRDFVAVDAGGGIHSLSRRIEGVTAKEVRARLSDLDLRILPTVAEAREIQKQRQAPGLEHGKQQHQYHSKDRERIAGWATNAAGNASTRRRALMQQFTSAIELRRSSHQRNGDPPPS
jgi:Relaxase/Mobilisation nuclease domain